MKLIKLKSRLAIRITKKDKHLPKDGIITNPATNSSFEVIDQINEKSKIFGVDTSGFSATVFKDTKHR